MRTHSRQSEPATHTIQGKNRAAKQANIHSVLQKYAQSIKNGELRVESVQRQADNELDEKLLQGKFETVQRETFDEEEPLQGKFDVAQREALDDEELLQGKFETAQREALDDDELLQGKFSDTAQRAESQSPLEGGMGAPNQTGIPDPMKTNFENFSGFSFDDVRVHYNSPKPAQLQALAYTQGSEVHIAPGQEKHLGHELGHVVQQKQGRVQPTMQLQGVNVNDNEGLEREADVFGQKAMDYVSHSMERRSVINNGQVAQREDDPDYGCTQEIYNQITHSYVMKKDIAPITISAKNQQIAISFRETGEDSIKQLENGAGAKGHNILEKTIKDKSLRDYESYQANPQLAELRGFVAVWKKDKTAEFPIEGLYLTQAGLSALDHNENFEVDTSKKYLKITEKNLEKLITDLEEIDENWQKFFFTGDYDIHDLVSFQHGHQTRQRSTVLADSDDEVDIRNALNKEMAATGEEYKRIQHGPQVSYIAHMKDKEPKKRLVPAVAGLSFPLAMCDRGTWSIIKDYNSLKKWYDDNSINMKSSWTDKESMFRFIKSSEKLHDFFTSWQDYLLGKPGNEKMVEITRKYKNENELLNGAWGFMEKKDRETMNYTAFYSKLCDLIKQYVNLEAV